MKYTLFLSILITIFLSSCSDSSTTSYSYPEDIDTKLNTLINTNKLTGNPANGKSIPSIDGEKAQLGMKLFFSKALGGNTDSACVTCHHPMLGGGDNLSLSIGVGASEPNLLGPGRIHDSTAAHHDGFAPVPRNAPTTFNVALWDKVLFWDGRVQTVPDGIRTPDSAFGVADLNAGDNLAASQARFPITSKEEMRGFTFEAGNSNTDLRNHLIVRLNDINSTDYIANTWQDEFTSVYGLNSVTMANIMDAIGEYENSQVLINNPWKQYIEGNTSAISQEAKYGALLFYSSYEDGGVSCVSCHSGDFFTNEGFSVMAIPQVGNGKGNGPTNDDDFGRFNEDQNSSKYSFRTPSLLNVEMTGPWGHNGAYTSLKGIVSHMVDIDNAVNNYDTSLLEENIKTTNTINNTKSALDQLNLNRTNGISTHKNVKLNDSQINNLVEFLNSLTDPCIKDSTCISKWIPKNEAGPDSLQLNAVRSF